MKKNLTFISMFGLFVFLFSGLVFAQNNRQTIPTTSDLYVISAKAGGVNYVEGKVVVQKNKRSGYLLKGDTVGVGDKVTTGADGKAEILLNPGSYIRLGENTGFEFLTTSLDNLQLKVTSGNAMLEVIANDDFNVAVKTPKADFSITTSGVYRISVLSDGSGKLAVWKGKAVVQNYNETEIKSGRESVVNGNNVAVTKFDRDNKDALEDWSKIRAKDLARINSNLQRQDVRNSLISDFNSSRWDLYNSFGLWVFNPGFGSFCFLPFGYGWDSPYGYNYGRDLWYFRLPQFIYNQPPPSGTGGGTTAVVKSRSRQIVNEPLPFESIQREIDRNKNVRIVDNNVFPSIAPQPSAAPVNIRPAGKGERTINN